MKHAESCSVYRDVTAPGSHNPDLVQALGLSTSASSLVQILRWEHDVINRIHIHLHLEKSDVKLIKIKIFLGEPVKLFLFW